MPAISIRKYLIPILVVMSLSACVSVPRDQSLANRGDAGLLVASVRVSYPDMDMDGSTLLRWATLTYHEDRALTHYGDAAISSRDAAIAIEGEKFAKVNVVALAPGDYSIISVQSAGFGDRLKEPMRFTIKPGRVTYLGMIHVRTLEDFRYRLTVSDEQERDVPLFLSRWTGVTRDLIDVRIPPRP